MAHLIDSELLAAEHGELTPGATAQVRSHLERCGLCSERFERLRGEQRDIGGLLDVLTFPVPSVSLDTIRRRARRPRRLVRAAAAIGTLVALASAAAAMPRSPVRAWLARIWAVAPEAAPATPRVADPISPTAGIAVSASAGVTIELLHGQEGGLIQVILADRPDVTARAVGGDVGYRVGRERIVMDNRTPAKQYEIELPRRIPEATVRVGGRVLWRLSDGREPFGNDTVRISLSLQRGRVP